MIIKEIAENNIPIISVITPFSSAKICLQGAHVMSWIPKGGDDVFYMSPISHVREGTALRGGVPICWPWFGKIKSPSHGTARIHLWSLDSCNDLPEGEIELTFSFAPEGNEALRAELVILVGKTLKQTLTTFAGSEEVVLSSAFHNYFSVGTIHKISIQGLEDVPHKKFAVAKVPHQEKPLKPMGAMDRIYPKVNNLVTLYDASLKRLIKITRTNAPSVVVWTPWDEGALSMKDLPDQEWVSFFCVEPGVVDEESVHLSPKETYTMTQEIEVVRD